MIDLATLGARIPEALLDLAVDWPTTTPSGKVANRSRSRAHGALRHDKNRLASRCRVAACPTRVRCSTSSAPSGSNRPPRSSQRSPRCARSQREPRTRSCRPLPVEVIVRGYITGSTRTALWTLYAEGQREIYSYSFPDGLQKNDPLPEPIITPTTKPGPGEHDERLTCAEVVERGHRSTRRRGTQSRRQPWQSSAESGGYERSRFLSGGLKCNSDGPPMARWSSSTRCTRPTPAASGVPTR